MNLKRYFPILDWGSRYSKTDFRKDLLAGITVAVILVPQGMAYALLAGLPPIYGLYAGTLPLFLYAFFGSSRQLSVGPVALVSLLVLSGLSNLGFEPYSKEFVAMAVSVALLAGVIQILLAIFRLGFLINFLSHPVISGFTTAAAFIIALSQIGNLLGISMERSNLIYVVLGNLWEHINEIHWPTAIIGFGGIIILLAIRRMSKAWPNALIAMVLGTLVVYFAGLEAEGVAVVGVVPQGLPAYEVPAFDLATIRQLMPLALTICLISFIESLAIAKTIESQRKDHVVLPNQELLALGITKIGGAFFQSFPTTGSFTRSAINNESGARTGVSSMITAVIIVFILLFLTSLFYYVPKAVLASVIMVAVVGLFDFKEARHLWKSHKRDFWAWMTTFALTLLVGIQVGVLSGVVVSLALILYRSSMPHVAVLGCLPDKAVYRNVDRFPDVSLQDDLLIVRFDAQLYFGNAAHFKSQVERAIAQKGEKLKLLILDASGIHGLDSTGVQALNELRNTLKSKKVIFFISGVSGPVRDIFQRENLFNKIGQKNHFISIHEAVSFFNKPHDQGWSNDALQTNE